MQQFFKIVYPSGAPILPNLLRYKVLVEDSVYLFGAVKYYSCAFGALYLPDTGFSIGKLDVCKIQVLNQSFFLHPMNCPL